MKAHLLFIVGLSFAITMSACQSSKNTNPTDSSAVSNSESARTVPTGLQSGDKTWGLYYITGPRIAFDGLFPDKKPTLIFDLENSRISGNAGCNQYGSGVQITTVGDSLRIVEPMMVTEMYCDGNMQGETTYLNMLKKINRYRLQGDSLWLLMNDVEMMGFVNY